MRLALRELLRKPGRFLVVGGALTLIVLLLLFLGALLDGLYLGSTGALRAQDADGIVYSADARDSLLRSRIDSDVRRQVEAVEGVDRVGGLSVTLLGAQVPGEADTADVAVLAYERPTPSIPEPPADGRGWADRRLEAAGAAVGDTLLVGPAEVPVTIEGWVEDTDYLLQAGVWVNPTTWSAVQAANRPDAVLPDGTFQALVLDVAPGADAATVRAAVDQATGGATDTLSQDEAVLALPGIKEQQATFTQIIGTTFFVAALVVALFFALVTLERLGTYAVLKAIGTRSRALVLGLVVQSAAIGLGAFVLGGLLTLGLSLGIPATVPVQFEPSRAASVAIGIVVVAVIGSLISLRRIIRIEPASALGAGI